MLKVAIVDDEEEVREALVAMVGRYSEENGVALRTSAYHSGGDFLASGAVEDIVLLDIEMEDSNGMDTARQLRERGIESEIVFVTNMAQYAIRGYEVSALDFMVKPVRYPVFAFKLRRAVEAASRKRSGRIDLDTRDGLRRVSTDDVSYVEVVRHKLFYHTHQGVFEVWGSMRAAREELEPFGFALCNACYLVNLDHVTALSGDMVTLRSGDELKMSRGKRREFLDALTNPSRD